MSTTLVAPHCAGTSCICGKIKKSNVLHYICHFTSDKNNFLYSWLFFSLTWAENEHWQPLVALRPLEAVKSFISCPCDTGKQPLIPKIVSDTGKMTNEWSKVLIPILRIQTTLWLAPPDFRMVRRLWNQFYKYWAIDTCGENLCNLTKVIPPSDRIRLGVNYTSIRKILNT